MKSGFLTIEPKSKREFKRDYSMNCKIINGGIAGDLNKITLLIISEKMIEVTN